MQQFLKGYFYGTKNELRGVLVLLIIIAITTFARFFITFPTSNLSTINLEEFNEKARLIAAMNDSKTASYSNENTETSFSKTSKLFNFNPNNASKSDFEQLGLSPRTAQSIINYRNKGGKFFKAADFKKIYTLSDADYQRLSSYIQIENNSKYPNQYSKKDDKSSNERPKTVEQFNFNPNNASKTDFERLGLSSRTAQSIINYRNKGGKFYKSEDLKKIYTLDIEDFERLKPYIIIPKIDNKQTKSTAKKYADNNDTPFPKTDYIKKSTTVTIDINTAEVADFQQLKGIGEGYAKRIIKYRNTLGGFTDVKQVKEVYGLEETTFVGIEKQLIVKEKAIQKININTATYIDLVKHPYIDGKRANAIVKYRKQHGNYKSVEDLKKNYAIPKATFDKIKDYLTI